MHELSYVVKIVDKAISAMNSVEGKVVCVHVKIGELTGALPEYLKMYYKQATLNTLLEGSSLSVEYMSARAKCGSCGKENAPNRKNDYLCPYCGSADAVFISGRELTLNKIEVEK